MTKTPDWRANILNDMAEETLRMPFVTFPSAYELMKVAAYNRRMAVGDFVGRSALAMAVYDSDGELSWRQVTDKEPPLVDIRTAGQFNVRRARRRGTGFGPWEIRSVR